MYGQSIPLENTAKHDIKGQSRNSAHKSVCSGLSDCAASRFHRAQ